MKVRAKALGYYGDRRRKEGDIFELVERIVGDKEKRRTLSVDQQFSEIWMEKLDAGDSVISEDTSKDTPKDKRVTKRKSNVI